MGLNSISPKVLKRKSIFVSLHISTYVILVGYTHSLQVVIQLFLHVLWLRARLPIAILSSLVYGTNLSRLHLVHAAAVSLPEHAPTYYSHPITTSLAFCTMPHYFKILLVSITLYIHLSLIYIRSHTQFFLLHCSHHLLQNFHPNCFSFLELACTTVTISILPIFKRCFY